MRKKTSKVFIDLEYAKNNYDSLSTLEKQQANRQMRANHQRHIRKQRITKIKQWSKRNAFNIINTFIAILALFIAVISLLMQIYRPN